MADQTSSETAPALVLAAVAHALVSRVLAAPSLKVEVVSGGRSTCYAAEAEWDRAVADWLPRWRPVDATGTPCAVAVVMSGPADVRREPFPVADRTLLVEAEVGDRGDIHIRRVAVGPTSDGEALAPLTVAHVQAAVQRVRDDPRLRLADVTLAVPEGERRQLAAWGRRSPVPVPNVPIHQLVHDRVIAAPEAEALSSPFEGVSLTYAQLWAKARRAAALLRRAGVGIGAVVALCVDEGAGLALGELAVAMAGGAFAPMNPHDPAARIADLWADLGATVVVLKASQAALYALAKGCGLRAIDAEDLFGEGSDVGVDPSALDSILVTGSDICHIIYTSGSTGRPKGVVMPHVGLVNYALRKAELHGVGPGDHVLMASASTFDPSLGDIFSAWAAGATVCLDARTAVMHSLGDSLRRANATHVLTTPALLAVGDATPISFPALRVVALGGEALPPSVVRTWGSGQPGPTLVNTYGVTEVCVYQTHHVVRGPDCPPKCIGKPYPNVDAAILDATQQPLPIGFVGELCLGGVQVAREYLNRPELSRERFIDVPSAVLALFGSVPLEHPKWYRTGDLARWLPSGNLELIGRGDAQVKVRGQRVEPGEIEGVLRGSPLAHDCAVTLLDGILCAFVVPHPDAQQEWRLPAGPVAPLPPSAVLALELYARARLPGHMVPQRFAAVQGIPVSTNGKVDRRGLPKSEELAAVLDGEHGSAHVPPEGPLETVVARLWSEELRLPVGATDHFFHLGGDSLSALRIARRLYCRMYHSHPPTEACPPIAPPYGDIQGPLSPWQVARFPVLRHYCHQLRAAGLSFPDREEDGTSPSAPPGPNSAAGSSPTDDDELADLAGLLVDEDANGSVDPTEPTHRPPEMQALFQALFDLHTTTVRALLEVNVSPDGGVTRQRQGTAPLHVAAATGNVAAVNLLLHHGARHHVTNRLHTTPVHLAAQHSAPALRAFLDHGVEPGVRDRNGQTLLHFAARHGNVPAVELLLKDYAHITPPDVTDRWERTPVHWTILNGHLNCMRRLLELKADPDPKPMLRSARRRTHLIPETPLQLAARVRPDDPAFGVLLERTLASRTHTTDPSTGVPI